MRRLPVLFLALALVRCACEPPPMPVTVHLPEGAEAGTRLAADDLERLLGRMGHAVSRAGLPAPACTDEEVHVLVLGHAHDEAGKPASSVLADQQLTIGDERCGRGRRLVLRGGGLLAGQWALYELLEQLGVRFFHPEQTYVPASTDWPERSLKRDVTPWFPRRSMSVHRTHPVELAAPLAPGALDMEGFQKRWIDWNVALRQTDVNGSDRRFVGDYARIRGFPSSAGINLLNAQQGGRPIIDPDDPRPEDEQIVEAIDRAMQTPEGEPQAASFTFQFNPNEFLEADHVRTVERLTLVADHMRANYPDVALFTINHGTHQPAREPYGRRFFDLSALAPPNLGVKVHTLMFYDLERAAPVYGNEDFRYLLDFTREQAEVRPIEHYPESSWWLTFDLPVPLYLAPVTLDARQYDLDLLHGLVANDAKASTGVVGHRLFTSGQEWGYWLIDYCVARMVRDAAHTSARCLDDFTAALAEGPALRRVLEEVRARQVDELRDPELLRYLVGSDDETEAAALAGIDFHPLPPAPEVAVRWEDDEARDAAKTLARLERMAEAYEGFARRVEATLSRQNKAQAPFVREMRDGLRVFGLRAAHAAEVYRTVLALRDALRAADTAAIQRAHEGVVRARVLTQKAGEVVAAREQDYRYPPELTIAGGEPGTDEALENSTIYPYRYLQRTHRLFYWTRPDDQLARLFGEGLELVSPSARMLVKGESLDIRLLADDVTGLLLNRGNGVTATELAPYVYPAQGLFDWTLDALTAQGAVHHDDRVAVVARRYVFRKGSLHVQEPPGAALLNGLLPGFEVGLGDDASGAFLALGRLDTPQPMSALGSVQRRARAGDASVPGDLELDLAKVGRIRVREARIAVEPGARPGLAIEGRIATGDIVTLLVSVGGFEREGAVKVVADVLGSTPEELPELVDFLVEAEGEAG